MRLCRSATYTRRTMPALLDRASRVALDLIFPPQCPICREYGELLCTWCVAMLPLAEQPRCTICWDDITAGSFCQNCVAAPPPFTSVRAPYAHEDGARNLVHQLKYDGLSSLAEPLASLMLDTCEPSDLDLIVPVPLHPSRQRSRGYNQAALLARHISREGGVDIDIRASRRVRKTKPLAQSMGRDERREIVAGAFAAEAGRVANRHILLVDDVVTTGATLAACSAALLDAGAATVRAVTFTRA